MSNAVSLLVSRPPGTEVNVLPSVHLTEQTARRKGNRTGGAFVQHQEVRAGTAPQRRAEFRLGSGGSTEARGQQKLPRTRAKVQAICASAAMNGWRRVAWSNTMLAQDVQLPLKKAQLETRIPMQVQPTPGRWCLSRIRAPSALCQKSALTLPSRGQLPGYALQLPLMSNVRPANAPLPSATGYRTSLPYTLACSQSLKHQRS